MPTDLRVSGMPRLGSTTIRDLMMTGSKGALDLIPAIARAGNARTNLDEVVVFRFDA